jgi:VCBS repeat-containing protein
MVYDIALLYDWDKMGTRTLGELTISARGLYTNNVTNQNAIDQALQSTVQQLKYPTMFQ